MSCLICERIEMIKNGTNPYFVCELETGYVVLGDHQRFKGYTIFLCKEHVVELHNLSYEYKMRYLEEMSLVAEAVYNIYKPHKMNYELLGNGDTHLHWHLFPRVSGDTPVKGPVWMLSLEEIYNDKFRPTKEELKIRTGELKLEIERLMKKQDDIKF